MKIFISHSSENKDYGNALVELLRGVGINENEVIFTSNTAYGIPISQNIFNWLKSQITEKPFVIYLLSKEYYSSIACLNEMGAAWVIENEHAILFTPNFDLSSKEFRDGAIDPREIGFYINDEERLHEFIQHLNKFFNLTNNLIIINQRIKAYLLEIEKISNKTLLNDNQTKVKTEEKINLAEKIEPKVTAISKPEIASTVPIYKSIPNDDTLYSKFIKDVLSGKLKDEELVLVFYLSDTGRSKFMTGWQEHIEIANIKDWEDIKEIDNVLSRSYDSAVRKLSLRGYTEVSATTGGGNPKEYKLKSDIETNILELPTEVSNFLNGLIEKFLISTKANNLDEGLPF